MAMPGWAALNEASLGSSHFSATDSTETMRTRRGGRALALGDAVDLGQDALHLLQIGPAAAVEVDAAAPALEQLGAEMLLQGADAVADGGGGDAELLTGQHEALVADGGLEEAQAFERWQVEHDDGPEGALW